MLKRPNYRDWHFVDQVEKKWLVLSSLNREELDKLHKDLRAERNRGRKWMILALALACHLAESLLHLRPHGVQILAAFYLDQGHLSQMNTGEGKTLTAALALFVQVLKGHRVCLLTSNPYLAKRDASFLAPFYAYFGYDLGLPFEVDAKDPEGWQFKQAAYQAPVIYSTHGALAFDYLMDQLASQEDKQVLSAIDFVLLDEADAVLLDAAQTPLIISGAPRVDSNHYQVMEVLASIFERGLDYEIDESKVQLWLKPAGVEKAQDYLQIENLYAEEEVDYLRQLILALRAREFFKKDRDYLVQEGQLLLLDKATGRGMDMTRLEGGQHQAIEAKEGLKTSPQTRALASISYQDFFPLFPRLAAMTATAKDDHAELYDSYGLVVYEIPPHLPLIRKDRPLLYFEDKRDKEAAVLEEIRSWHEKGGPVLVVASHALLVQDLSKILLKAGLPHQLLIARHSQREAAIIAEAGQKGRITLATAMAGRGTDILLGPGAEEAGGLLVIGLDAQLEGRLDAQIRGRAGRQGQKGQSIFFASSQDPLLENWPHLGERSKASQRAKRTLIKQAQALETSRAQERRRRSQEFNWILREQREAVYNKRQQILASKEEISSLCQELLDNYLEDLKQKEFGDGQEVLAYCLGHLSYSLDPSQVDLEVEKQELASFFASLLAQGMERQEASLARPDLIASWQRLALLKALDKVWIDRVDYLEELMRSFHPYGQAQLDPYLAFMKEADRAFQALKPAFREEAVRNLLLSHLIINQEGEVVLHFP